MIKNAKIQIINKIINFKNLLVKFLIINKFEL